jgi:uncharacterized protein (TIGR02118 family)
MSSPESRESGGSATLQSPIEKDGYRLHKLILVFTHPPDVTVFERRWSEEFVPAAERMPGLRRVTAARGYGGPSGPSEVYLVHEYYFDDEQALRRALTSPEGQQAGRALMGFADRQVSLTFAEHLEEERPIPSQAG